MVILNHAGVICQIHWFKWVFFIILYSVCTECTTCVGVCTHGDVRLIGGTSDRHLRVVLKCASTDCGAQCVMTRGIIKTQEWYCRQLDLPFRGKSSIQ